MHIAWKERTFFRIKVPECFIDRSTQVHRKLCVTRASLRDQDSLSAGHLEWNSNVEFFPHDSPLEGTLRCLHYIISSFEGGRHKWSFQMRGVCWASKVLSLNNTYIVLTLLHNVCWATKILSSSWPFKNALNHN